MKHCSGFIDLSVKFVNTFWMTRHSNSLVQMQNVSLSFSGKRPLFNIKEFQLEKDEHVVITGPSGSGKSTFLHLLSGLIAPDKGYVYIEGKNFFKMNEEERADFRRSHIALVFQKLNILSHLNLTENLALVKAPELSDSDHQVLSDKTLKSLGLTSPSQLAGTLSLGEQQRLAIGRALIQTSAKLILADEPTSSLDKTNADFVMKKLKSAAQGKALIVVSHDLRILPQFDRQVRFEDWQ